MYCVIKYIDYRKEQSIEFLGYSDNQEKAIEFALKKAEEFKTKYGYQLIGEKQDHSYLHISNKNKLIKEFMCFSFERESDEKIQEYINNTPEKETIKQFINDCAGKIEYPEYESIKDELVHDQSVETIRKILEYVAIKNPHHRDFGPEISDCSAETFAVVFVESI